MRPQVTEPKWAGRQRKFQQSGGIMNGEIMKRTVAYIFKLLLVVGLLASGAIAQSQSGSGSSSSADSLADYARTIRKNSDSKSKPQVFTNDNLPTTDKLSVVGSAESTDNAAESKSEDSNSTGTGATDAKPASQSNATSDKSAENNPVADATPQASKPGEDEAAKQAAWKHWGEQIQSQKDQIDLLTRELNVLQKEYEIRAAAMYGDVGNRLRNSADWDKQDAQYKQQIADKQKAVDDAKQKLDDMQEEARKAGVPSSIREP